jgi:hypothetical protein
LKYEQYEQKRIARQANLGKIFAIDRLQAEPVWEATNKETDVIRLLKLIPSNTIVRHR